MGRVSCSEAQGLTMNLGKSQDEAVIVYRQLSITLQ